MVAFRNTIILVIVVSFFTFVALFGRLPALRKTPIGFLQRLLCLHIPSGFRRLDSNYTGGRLNRSIASLTNYLLYQKNPVVLVSHPSPPPFHSIPLTNHQTNTTPSSSSSPSSPAAQQSSYAQPTPSFQPPSSSRSPSSSASPTTSPTSASPPAPTT